MVSYLCDVAGVSRSGYYNYFSRRSQERRKQKDEQDEIVKFVATFLLFCSMCSYDIWADDQTSSAGATKSAMSRLNMRIPAPKMPLPTHAESYNPPKEYLFDKEEVGL